MNPALPRKQTDKLELGDIRKGGMKGVESVSNFS